MCTNLKQRLLVFTVVFATIFTAGCFLHRNKTENSKKIEAFIQLGYDFTRFNQKTEIVEKYGNPLTIKKEPYLDPNSQSKESGLIYTFFYKDLELCFFEKKPGATPFFVSVSIFNAKWSKDGVYIGMPQETLLELFGEQERSLEENEVEYCSQSGADSVKFIFRSKKLSKIEWYFYTG